ncbi:MAG: NAD-binding protein, partial [Candidatus Brocadiaceae bacterium]
MRGDEQPDGGERGALRRAWHVLGRLDYEWVLIGLLWVIAFILGCTGFATRAAELGEEASRWDVVYLSLQLFTLESGAVSPPVPLELQIARFTAPIVAAVTALRALLLIFHRQVQRWRARRRRGHVVICGLGRKGFLLARGFADRGRRVVVVEQQRDNENLQHCQGQGMIALVGDASEPQMLRKAGVPRARHLFAVTGDDGANSEIAVHARDLLPADRQDVLTCVVHNVQPDLCSLLRRREVTGVERAPFRVQFFNVYHSGARALLAEYPVFGETGDTTEPHAHILVVGLGQLGTRLIVQGGRQWVPRFRETGQRLRVVMADRDAERSKEALCLRYPDLAEVCDVVACPMDVAGAEVDRLRPMLAGTEGRSVTAAYVCLDSDSLTIKVVLALNRLAGAQGWAAPIVAVLDQEAGIASLLRGGENGEFARVHAFPLLDRTCTPEILLSGTHEVLARAVHEEYVRQQSEQGQTPQTNPRMVSWEKLPEWVKESNRRQADHIGAKLRRVGCDVRASTEWDPADFRFTEEEVEVLAEMEHERWMAERLM